MEPNEIAELLGEDIHENMGLNHKGSTMWKRINVSPLPPEANLP